MYTLLKKPKAPLCIKIIILIFAFIASIMKTADAKVCEKANFLNSYAYLFKHEKMCNSRFLKKNVMLMLLFSSPGRFRDLLSIILDYMLNNVQYTRRTQLQLENISPIWCHYILIDVKMMMLHPRLYRKWLLSCIRCWITKKSASL